MSRVAREVVSILPDPVAGEVNIVVSGYRISLTADEAAVLARGLLNCLGNLRWGERRAMEGTGHSKPSLPEALPRIAASDEAAAHSESAAPPAADAGQQRTRALIQASIREKGLSLREERRS